MHPSFKLRNCKLCLVSGLRVTEYSSNQQRLWSDCDYAQAGLSLLLVAHTTLLEISCWGSLIKQYSCIDVYSYSCLHPLSNERKSMFKSGDLRAVWTLVRTGKYSKWALYYLHDVIYRKRCEPDWSFRQCFCSRKHCVRLWRCDDIMTFESTQPTPFCLEKSSERKWTI